MVFCGKASLSCKNCRVRRIKCNRLEPECSQCIRAGKKCPGYRDQLSLMFRDETVKVKKKFQEVDSEAPGTASASAATPTSSLPGELSSSSDVGASRKNGRFSRSQSSLSPGLSSSDSGTDTQGLALVPTQQPPRFVELQPTLTERGFKFYVDHYLFGHPDEPDSMGALSIDHTWLFTPAANTIAAAIGLAGLSNLVGDAELKMAAWQNYVLGLRLTGATLASMETESMNSTMRTIVLLAIFEIVRGAHLSTGSANTHVMGATAVMHSALPRLSPSIQPYRSLMQFLYSMLIPCHASGKSMPPSVLAYANNGLKVLTTDEQRSTDLFMNIAEFVDISAYVRSHVVIDGQQKTADLIARLRRIDANLVAWEEMASASPTWKFDVRSTTTLPHEACYNGLYHKYSDMAVGRIWGFYRWARILNGELLLQLFELCPQSAIEVVTGANVYGSSPVTIKSESGASPESEVSQVQNASTPTQSPPTDSGSPTTSIQQIRQHMLRVIRQVADDSLVSAASYWRHPHVSAEAYAEIVSPLPLFSGKGGSGAVGLTPMLFHVQVASCAPGMSYEGWRWALDTVETVWALLGMEQARSLADVIRAHRESTEHRLPAGNGRPLLISGYRGEPAIENLATVSVEP